MKQKTFLLGLLLLLPLLAISCGTNPQPTPTNTPETFVGGECDTPTERIEMNKHLSKGVGPSYSFPDPYSVYCLWVPDGSQLNIGISDLYSDLNLHVAKDLFTRWESYESGTQDELVTITNPGGRYYIWVCTKGSKSPGL